MVTITAGAAQHAEDARILTHGPGGPLWCWPHAAHGGTQARGGAPTRRAAHMLWPWVTPAGSPAGSRPLGPGPCPAGLTP